MQVVKKMLKRWSELEDLVNFFITYQDHWQPIFDVIGIDINDAWLTFYYDYENAVTKYNEEQIEKIWDLVYQQNYLKYQKLITVATAEYAPIDNYNMIEEGQDTRTPNLTNQVTLNTTSATTDTRSTTSTGTSNTNSAINQTKTTTDSPQNFKETSTHSVNPYDNPGFTNEYKDEVTQEGIRTVQETYTGNPDTTAVTSSSTSTNSGGTSTSNTGSNTSTETGTDTTTHRLTRHGNIGVTTSQQMLESELVLADKMNLFKIIEHDLASKIFLQVWL